MQQWRRYLPTGARLTPKTIRQLNGANSRLMTHISGKTIREEARANSTSYDLVLSIRKRRLCWLRHMLRLGLIRRAIVEQLKEGEGR